MGSGKHSSILEAAKFELNEEAGLMAKTWIPLTSQGVAHDKYSDNRFNTFLALNCSPVSVSDRRAMDDAESIEVHPGKTADDVLDIIEAGTMNVAGCYACMLALRAIERQGLSLR